MTSDESCPGHGFGSGDLGDELRELALTVLDRLQPVVEKLRDDRATGGTPASCTTCPVCAVLAALRGERPELIVRLAEHTSGLLTVLRSVLEQEEQPAPPRPPGRTVQRIPVTRA
jgi:hypothetical protein